MSNGAPKPERMDLAATRMSAEEGEVAALPSYGQHSNAPVYDAWLKEKHADELATGYEFTDPIAHQRYSAFKVEAEERFAPDPKGVFSRGEIISEEGDVFMGVNTDGDAVLRHMNGNPNEVEEQTVSLADLHRGEESVENEPVQSATLPPPAEIVNVAELKHEDEVAPPNNESLEQPVAIPTLISDLRVRIEEEVYVRNLLKQRGVTESRRANAEAYLDSNQRYFEKVAARLGVNSGSPEALLTHAEALLEHERGDAPLTKEADTQSQIEELSTKDKMLQYIGRGDGAHIPDDVLRRYKKIDEVREYVIADVVAKVARGDTAELGDIHDWRFRLAGDAPEVREYLRKRLVSTEASEERPPQSTAIEQLQHTEVFPHNEGLDDPVDYMVVKTLEHDLKEAGMSAEDIKEAIRKKKRETNQRKLSAYDVVDLRRDLLGALGTSAIIKTEQEASVTPPIETIQAEQYVESATPEIIIEGTSAETLQSVSTPTTPETSTTQNIKSSEVVETKEIKTEEPQPAETAPTAEQPLTPNQAYSSRMRALEQEAEALIQKSGRAPSETARIAEIEKEMSRLDAEYVKMKNKDVPTAPQLTNEEFSSRMRALEQEAEALMQKAGKAPSETARIAEIEEEMGALEASYKAGEHTFTHNQETTSEDASKEIPSSYEAGIRRMEAMQTNVGEKEAKEGMNAWNPGDRVNVLRTSGEMENWRVVGVLPNGSINVVSDTADAKGNVLQKLVTAEMLREWNKNPLVDKKAQDSATNESDTTGGQHEVADEAEKVEHELPPIVAEKYLSALGLKVEELKSIEGFAELSEGKQLLLLRNMQSEVLRNVTKDAAETQKEEWKNRSLWGKMWRGALSMGSYQFARTKTLEKQLLSEAKGDTTDEAKRAQIAAGHIVDISEYVKVMQEMPDVRVSQDGSLEIAYISPEEKFGTAKNLRESSENTLAIESFNTVASSFSKIPREWGYEPKDEKSKAERKRYDAEKANYDSARASLLSLYVKKFKEEGAADPEKAALTELNRADELLELNQLFNAHPDVEKTLKGITGQNAILAGAMEFMRDKGKYIALGAGTRVAAGAVLGALTGGVGIAVATGVGAVVGKMQGEADAMKIIRERRIDRRLSEEDEREEVSYTDSLGKTQTRKIKEYTDATFFVDRIERLSAKLEQATTPEEKALLESKIAKTNALMEEKYQRGLINFGGSSLEADDARKGNDIANKLSFMQAMGKASAIEIVDQEKLEGEIAHMLDSRQEEIEAVRSDEVKHAGRKAAMIRGAFALGGAVIAGEIRDSSVVHHVYEKYFPPKTTAEKMKDALQGTKSIEEKIKDTFSVKPSSKDTSVPQEVVVPPKAPEVHSGVKDVFTKDGEKISVPTPVQSRIPQPIEAASAPHTVPTAPEQPYTPPKLVGGPGAVPGRVAPETPVTYPTYPPPPPVRIRHPELMYPEQGNVPQFPPRGMYPPQGAGYPPRGYPGGVYTESPQQAAMHTQIESVHAALGQKQSELAGYMSQRDEALRTGNVQALQYIDPQIARVSGEIRSLGGNLRDAEIRSGEPAIIAEIPRGALPPQIEQLRDMIPRVLHRGGYMENPQQAAMVTQMESVRAALGQKQSELVGYMSQRAEALRTGNMQALPYIDTNISRVSGEIRNLESQRH